MSQGFSFDYENIKGERVRQLGNLLWRSASTNKVKIRSGAVVELWFTNSHLLEQRKNIVAVWHDFYDRFKDKLTHYQKNNANRLSQLTDGFPTHFEAILDELDEEEFFDGALWGCETKQRISGEAVYWYIGGSGDTKITGGETNIPLEANLHIDWLLDNPQAFVQMVVKWCGMLGAVHGSAGAGLIFEQGGASRRVYEQGFPMAKRFPGLDYPNTPYFGLNSSKGKVQKRGIRGVNWLTILDDSYVSELGGLAKITEELGDDILVHGYDGGVVIQAGEIPEIGDVNYGAWPELYRKVNHVIKPVRFEEYRKPYLFVPEPMDGLDETMKWIRRFDDVGD